jgi:ferredoxin-fold anticodon binding domain-containing protein
MKMMPDGHFVSRIAALQQTIDHLPDKAVRAVISELTVLKRQVGAEILDIDPARYQAVRLRTLQEMLDDVLLRRRRRRSKRSRSTFALERYAVTLFSRS